MFTVLCEDGMGGNTVRGNSLIFLNVATIRKYINGYFHILKKKTRNETSLFEINLQRIIFLAEKKRG